MTGAEIVARPIVDQGLVRFLSPNGNHDRRTDALISCIQAAGVAWFGGATWRGTKVMRISVCNWQTTEHNVDAAIAAVRTAMSATRG
jgi:hypothetical protein